MEQKENRQPNKLKSMMQTFDEENKHQLSKSVPRNSSKPRKSKHKRQATLVKFVKGDIKGNKTKAIIQANSNLSVDSHPKKFEAKNSKPDIVNKAIKEIAKYHTLDQSFHQSKYFNRSLPRDKEILFPFTAFQILNH